MSNLLLWVKGLGVAIGGAVVLSTNSTIALINQNTTPFHNLSKSNFNKVIENNTSENNALKINYSIDTKKTNIKDTMPQTNTYFSLEILFNKPITFKSDWCPPLGFCG